jgi:hypothetical protein
MELTIDNNGWRRIIQVDDLAHAERVLGQHAFTQAKLYDRPEAQDPCRVWGASGKAQVVSRIKRPRPAPVAALGASEAVQPVVSEATPVVGLPERPPEAADQCLGVRVVCLPSAPEAEGGRKPWVRIEQWALAGLKRTFFASAQEALA